MVTLGMRARLELVSIFIIDINTNNKLELKKSQFLESLCDPETKFFS